VSDRPESASDDVLSVSELFESVQGEGASAGAPCVFLRLSHCNLRCSWCDTKYSWDFRRYRIEDETALEGVADIARRVQAFGSARLVVTGGEPLIQQHGLARLFTLLPPELAIEIETNGTLEPLALLLERVTQWNVSPKLANGGDPLERRLRPRVLATLLATERAYLKLVVATRADAEEAEALITSTGWAKERVFLMAQAATRVELGARAPLVQAEALRRGLRYSPRLHVERWDGARGK
jgi:organic radical activating enzyme